MRALFSWLAFSEYRDWPRQVRLAGKAKRSRYYLHEDNKDNKARAGGALGKRYLLAEKILLSAAVDPTF
jgi:hypothetical protein